MADHPPSIRCITQGPRFHWFGYYDKLQFDLSGRYALAMEVDFEHRSPQPDDVIQVGMVDLADGDRWIPLDQSCAWCWQQGCMLQWRPGSESEILWNDRHGERFVSHILNIRTRHKRTLPLPTYTISPDGRTALSVDFRRINDMRPGYGYAGLVDPHRAELAPPDAGIWRIDLETGASELIVTLADVARIPYPHADLSDAKHYFNHLLFNTDGSRFVFLHRWRWGVKPFMTRMVTAALDGRQLWIVDDSGYTSHFIWRDPHHLLAWTHHPSHGFGFYLFRDRSDLADIVGQDVMTVNGHCTYLPGNDWILNDTYPDEDGLQHLYLYHVTGGERRWLGHFHSPAPYRGEWRCDLHPRFSRDGRTIAIDSAHAGQGRQLFLLDVTRAVD